MEIEGKIKLIGDTQSFGNNDFTKRMVVLSTNEQYSQDIPIDFIKEKCSILDKYRVGQNVKIGINLRGNEYNGKYYLNAQGWRIEKVQQNNSIPKAPEDKFEPAPDLNDKDDSDLPF